MRLVVLQPGYLPWLGFFDQMVRSDIFVVYDDVQYDRRSWRNRNRIKTHQGVQWLTIPVATKGNYTSLIKDVLIDNSTNWRKNHLRSIQQNYSKAPFFADYYDVFCEMYSKEWKYLIDVDLTLIRELRSILGIESRMEFSSDLCIDGDKVHRMVNICLELGADELLEGSAGRNYLTGEGERAFAQNGIKLTYHDYQHPVYGQLYGEFVPYLSVIDLLFNCGKDSLDIITNKKEKML